MTISLEDRMEILDLCARYNYLIDTGQAEAWADTFTEDGTFEGSAGKASGRAALVAFCTQFAKDYPGGMHFTDNHLLEEDGGAMKHRCFLSFQIPGPNGTNVILVSYEDVLVKTGGGWRFRSRLVVPLRP